MMHIADHKTGHALAQRMISLHAECWRLAHAHNKLASDCEAHGLLDAAREQRLLASAALALSDQWQSELLDFSHGGLA